VAAVATLLNAIGMLLSPPTAAELGVSVINRATGALAHWAVAALVWQALRERQQAQRLMWLQRGQAAVAQALLGQQTVAAVAAGAARALSETLGADAALVYRLEGGQLVRVAGHATDEASAPERIPLGQGVAGEVGRTGRPHLLSPLPPGHLNFASALGRSEPQHVLVAPITADEVLCGVVELGFVRRDADFGRELELLRLCAEDIGVALRSAMYREREVQLLEQTQRQSQELQAQQEELRVTNEELEEQSRALQESKVRLENQQAELEQSNVQLEEQAQALQRQKQSLLQAQQELRAHAEQLAAANRYKSEFLANMSHELRTPLNSSMILAKLLADNRDGNLGPDQVKYARTILAANNDLLALINDILDLSKIEAGRVDFAVEPLLLQELLDHLRSVLEPMAQQKQLAFRVEMAEGAPALLRNDPRRLQQILKNLLANAVKFTDEGSVELTVRAAANARVRFEVRDTGIGIPREQQRLIFEAFRQADGSASRRYGGTGLGLFISHQLAQRMGGGIEVDSEPGRGSCFTLELPVDASAALQQAAEPAAAPPPHVPKAVLPGAAVRAAPVASAPEPPPAPPPATPPAAGGRAVHRRPGRLILAVEDDPAFAKVLVDLAHEQDFDAIVASTAADALRIAREQRPSAVLLDVVLPDASGLAVLEQLKRDPATRHIPVHMVSGYERTRPALELGAVGYVMKPATREDLVAAIQRLEQRLQSTVRRLLIVEDDDTLRDNLKLLLQGERIEITAVGRVEQALQRLQDTSFDCMVTDLTLPDGTGYDLLERMAANERLAFPPVIVYTGRALSRDEEQRLRRYSKSIIVKGARSPERLVDEVTLFLHSVEAALPADQQRLLRQARRRDRVLDGRRLLLAEDDVRNVFALTGLFEPLGAQLVVARNGREALDKLEHEGADLVLMDVMMPEMDGIAAMRAIRERPQWHQLPIIALTAKAMADDRERCLEAGANDYIAKPIDADKLVSLCRVWCPK
jgi:signal transduction histidine kinase/DNA-binding response OmpR family regulator